MVARLRPWLIALCLVGNFGCNQGGQGGPAASPEGAAHAAENQAAEAEAAVLLLAAQAALEFEAAVVAEALIAEEAEFQQSERKPDVIYVPTPEPVVDRMLELAAVQEGDVVYDLGCGDGRIVITAAERYGVKAWGFDIDPERVAEARNNAKAAGVEHLVTIEQKDIFTLDLSPASVITLYLLPELNVRLIPQLEKLKPGSRVVSHDFDMEGVPPRVHETLELGARDTHEIFLWHAPLSPEPSASESAAEPGSSGATVEPKPDSTKPDSTKPDSTKPDSTKPDSTKPQPDDGSAPESDAAPELAR